MTIYSSITHLLGHSATNIMHPRSTVLLFLIFLSTIATSSSPTAQTARHHHLGVKSATGGNGSSSCLPHERDALLEFKQGITGDPAGLLVSWNQGTEQDCCKWTGVRCSNETGRVVAIQLRNPRADGSLWRFFPWETALAGQISPSLLSLHHLEHLDLSFNNLSGPTGRVPEFLGLLNNLRYLNLSRIPFIGRLPPQLGNLSKLHYLDLSQSSMYSNLGEAHQPNFLYSTDISWLSKLPLRYLSLASVNLSTVDDWAHVVNMVPSLKVIRFPGCKLASANQSLSHLNLTSLEELSLTENHFGHPVASCWFWNLTSLQHLELARTNLYGKIPGVLGGMTSLRVLNFQESGIYSLDISSANMTNLCNLESLDLSSNFMNGKITEFLPQCSHNKLKELHLGRNSFTGILPNWIGYKWSSLVILELHGNQLSGNVPSEIGMLNNLTIMDLSNNKLTGVITREHFAGLASLRKIDLSSNYLKIAVDPEWLPPFQLESAQFRSCNMGPLFPSWLKSQFNIDVLDISNASIFDMLPDWFFTTFSKATELYASNNGINGTLPATMGNMTSLDTLYMYSNQLTGRIPQLPITLAWLDISMNYLSGPLPSNFGAQYMLQVNLFSNRITGHIPQSICQLNDVENLNLANNHLEGGFPQCFEPSGVEMLILSNNMLSGNIPSFLETCTKLYTLDLSWNKFTGSIPETITNLGVLTHLNLAGNRLSGVLPQHLSKLMGMMRSGDDNHPFIDNNMNMSMTMKGQERYYYNLIIYEVLSIDLSSNHLTGQIPEEIVSLIGLVNLNLSRNYLTGKVLENIGTMQSLESLDLSENKFFGEIPQSLSKLTFLSYLDLSHNNFTGRIPSGGQLDTLYQQNPFMYDFNSGLCGHPLQSNCSGNTEQEHDDHKRDGHESNLLSFSFGLIIGYAIGLWVVFCVTLFKKSWRIAYFGYFDKACDKVYVAFFVTWGRWTKTTAQH